MKQTSSSKDFAKISNTITIDMNKIFVQRNIIKLDVASCDHSFSESRQHAVKVVDLPTVAISMTVGGLEPDQSTRMHRHNYETILYIVEGSGKSLIEDQEVLWEQGDAVYIPVWAWHRHTNLGSKNCVYIACENAPIMQNLNAALREEI